MPAIDLEALHQRMWLKGECDHYPPDKWRLVEFQAGAEDKRDGTWAFEQLRFELRNTSKEGATK
jgi:hypothetical protein